MKYESNTKTGRNLDLISMRKNNKNLSLNDIAFHFRISKTRVCQILKKYKAV